MIGIGQVEVRLVEVRQPRGRCGGEAQRVANPLERRAEPWHGDRIQLGKRPKLRRERCDDGVVDGLELQVACI